ncbi:MAG: F0F1 ATP synthase subunit B [Bacteroidales bacterium]|nr:F0F1 ATP synthase subunit B [Bacteroidales bacterium]MDD7726164.1 F0F1 ATP synthase subunit B [Bacteroidales bacterium]MDY4174728.1 F0F1 ATP synthase subunit B [Bacteroidales bacterium]
MEGLLSPEPGLVIWSGLTFLVVLALLTKFAWKPLLSMLKEREDEITSSLQKAKEARQEFERIEAQKSQMLAESRAERDAIIKEARAKVDAMIEEAKARSQQEADKLIEQARAQIEREKAGAIDDLKRQVATLSVQIAGKLIESNLAADNSQEQLIEKYLQESNFN